MFGGGFPFFGGGFDDDMPHGHGHGHGGPKEPANTTELYEILGVEKDATPSAIKKAYRKICLKEHPDKGGDVEKFQKAQEAYDILSDEKKRPVYDKGGKEAVEMMGQGGGMGGDDLASMFFGGGRRRQGPAKTKDVVRAFPVKLEDVYNGKTKRFAITRSVLCPGCRGSGAKKGKSFNMCDGCNGRGVRIIVRRMGAMIQQMQVACTECHGQGKTIDDADKCGDCSGAQTTSERKVVEVHVEKGMKHGQRITLRGHADEEPEKEPGDLIFVLQVQKHDVFTRRRSDLAIKKSITLLEALAGVTFVLKHLDGQEYFITSKPGEVIDADAVKAVPDLGMPLYGNPYTRGNLFIEFHIDFPADGALTKAQLATLKSVLPGPTSVPELTEDMEEVNIKTVNLEEEAKRAMERDREAYESDDEDGHGGGGQQVRCAQQ